MIIGFTTLHPAYAVIGLGFGDEGKGQTTHALCRDDSLVVRFSGGQQAGHTVTLPDDRRHVFSNFGSGTLKGCPTYWSEHCTVDPVGMQVEYEILTEDCGVQPLLYLDYRCPVTTPFEKMANRALDMENGTCGCGVGRTWEREENHHHLSVGDLFYPSVVQFKLELVKNSYAFLGGYDRDELDEWYEAVEWLCKCAHVQITDHQPDYPHIVFEGSQGLLLDQTTGFFPHVTRSNTGTTNIPDAVAGKAHYYLVTRCYQTRHGNGPMTNEHLPVSLINNEHETNQFSGFQGEFRTSALDIDLLEYGINRDPILRYGLQVMDIDRTLVITCLDQIDGNYRFTHNGVEVIYTDADMFCDAVAWRLGIEKFVMCAQPDFSNLETHSVRS